MASLRCNFEGKTFVQVIYNGSHHWVAATNKNCRQGVFLVYDSLRLLLNVDVKQQLAAMCHAPTPALEVQSMNVTRQAGSGDCGLLALAYATSVCLGQDPVNLVYDQENLRKHFLKCVNDDKITAFPICCNRTVRKPVAFTATERLYCVCRQIYVRGQHMIQCQSCHNWYHAACLSLSDSAFADAAEKTQYICQRCNDVL